MVIARFSVGISYAIDQQEMLHVLEPVVLYARAKTNVPNVSTRPAMEGGCNDRDSTSIRRAQPSVHPTWRGSRRTFRGRGVVFSNDFRFRPGRKHRILRFTAPEYCACLNSVCENQGCLSQVFNNEGDRRMTRSLCLSAAACAIGPPRVARLRSNQHIPPDNATLRF